MTYAGDLNPEDIMDILVTKGLLTEEDIENYIINEAEDEIYLSELEELRIREHMKEAEEQIYKEHTEKRRKREAQLKEILPNAYKIISDSRKSNLIMKTAWIWWVAGMAIGIWYKMPAVMLVYYLAFLIQICYGSGLSPSTKDITLAEDAKEWFEHKPLANNNRLDGGGG